jgi:hypothetical protein
MMAIWHDAAPAQEMKKIQGKSTALIGVSSGYRGTSQ